MENVTKSIISNVLKEHCKIIVQDIQGDVILILYEKQVLTENEYNDIKSKDNREEEARRLLELLPLKGYYGISQFIEYMMTEYPWIGESVENSMSNEYNDLSFTNIRQVLTVGEVPQLSSRHVSRSKLVNTLEKLLIELQPGHFVVVNGMPGCGKSSLVADVLNNPIITMRHFQGFVQWINVGRENSSDVGYIQTEILNRLKNEELLISPPLNTEYETTRKTLLNLLKTKKLTNGLLVLDDVCNPDIVKYLNIGCKILITTHDESIMDDLVDTRIKFMKVDEGLEEIETLNLFSKCLNIDCTSLPSHASKLHRICKGFPLTISLIGAQLESHKEESINNTDRWTFYLEELSDYHKKNSTEAFKHTRHSVKLFKSLEKAIEMCIKNLPDDLRNNYLDFALFVCDLNIKPEVLSVLWNLKKVQVEDIMLELTRKSLVVRMWIHPLNSYVYSIHDLLLSNLKQMINQQESTALHKKLIERYRVNCCGNFAQLPINDNYIFLYFGYHLKNADMLEEFPRWFLNLKFLEAKIYVTGPADLLMDLKKYRKYIAIDSTYEKYVKEIESFVKRFGPNLYQTKGDIAQLGLQEPKTSFIYKESYELTKKSKESYFHYNIRASTSCLTESHVSLVRDDIETAIFGNRHDEILIATKSGNIKVWNVISHKCLYTYRGHTARVTHLAKNKSKSRFLSTSDDKTIRVWNMITYPNSSDSEVRTPSPQTRQDHWQNLFHQNHEKSTNNTDCIFILKSHLESVIFAQFSSDDKLLVSSSTDKTLKIWKLDDEKFGISGNLHETINQTSVVDWCCFMESNQSDRILFSTFSNETSVIYGCQWPFDHCTGLLYLNERVLSFFPIASTEGDGQILIVTPKKVQTYQLFWDKSLRLKSPLPHPKGYQDYILSAVSEDYTTIANHPRYVAFSLSNFTIQICDLDSGYNFLDLNDPIQGILNLDWFLSKNDQSNWLLCVAEDKSIRLWCLNNITQYTCVNRNLAFYKNNKHLENICKNETITLEKYKSMFEKNDFYCYKLQQNFDAVWLENNSLLIAAISKCGTLKILLSGIDKWSIINQKVLALSIVCLNQTLDKTMVITACEDNSVYSLKYKVSEYLFSTSSKVDRVFSCLTHNNLIIGLLLKPQPGASLQDFVIWMDNETLNECIEEFIDCYVFHDKVIILYKTNDIKVIYLNTKTIIKLEVHCLKINGSLMLDNSKLAITDNRISLKIYELTFDHNLIKIDHYTLPPSFKENELTSLSLSNNKNYIVVGGCSHIAIIDKILNTSKNFTDYSSMKNIQSMVWSSDDTRLAIKDDNKIIVFDVQSGKKIASVRLTSDKFLVDSMLKTYIAINTTGQLVMLHLINYHCN